MDEQAHLARGLSYAATGDLRLYIGHPPLANLIAAVPVLLDPRLDLALDDPAWAAADWIEYPISLFWKRANPALAMFAAGRVMIVLLGLVLLAGVYRLGADLGGPAAGLAALLLAALDPNLRAHARLITTDLAVTLMLVLTTLLWRRWRRRPAWPLSLATGAAAGLALASKFPALIWIGALAGFTALTEFRRWRALLLLGASAALTLWAVYGFDWSPAAGLPFAVPLGRYWDEFYWSVTAIAQTPAYLLGEVSRDGFWAYFPVALAVKTPLPLLGLALAGLWLGRRAWRAEAGLWVPALAFLGVAVLARINIGYRHILPLLPLAYAAGGAALVWLARRAGRWAGPGRWAAGLLTAWLAVNTLLIYPHDLTFFNELAGGPDNGWRYLVDSNLDWGQDLGELVAFTRQRGIDTLYLSYFGSVPVGSFPVAAYPLPARPLPPRPSREWRPFFPQPGWYAISVTHLLGGAVLDDPDTFAFFRQRRPDAVLGRTIYVYQVPAESGTLAICNNPPPNLNPHEARQRFGAAVTRLLMFNCERGLPLPAGRAWYLLRGEQVGLVQPALERLGASLIYAEPQRTDPAFAFSIYELDGAAARAAGYAPAYPGPATFGGLATFLGWRYADPAAGRPRQVETVWRVEAALPAPLSIFLHLTAADGFPLAVSDGLNAPFDALQPGDVVLQFHPLPDAPAELPAGAQFQAGLYALAPPQARYPLPDGQTAVVFPP